MSICTEWKAAVSTKTTDLDTLRHYKGCSIDAIELSVPWQDCEYID